MSLAEDIYQHSLRLPAHAAQEALDFIAFLESRYANTATSAPIQDHIAQQQIHSNMQQLFGLVKSVKHVSLQDMEQAIAAGKNRHVVD